MSFSLLKWHPLIIHQFLQFNLFGKPQLQTAPTNERVAVGGTSQVCPPSSWHGFFFFKGKPPAKPRATQTERQHQPVSSLALVVLAETENDRAAAAGRQNAAVRWALPGHWTTFSSPTVGMPQRFAVWIRSFDLRSRLHDLPIGKESGLHESFI